MHPWVRSGGWRKITRGECIIQRSQYSGSDRHQAEYQWECESGNERKWKWPIITCPFVCLPAAMFTIGKNLWQTQIRRWPRPPSIRGLLFSRDGKWYLRMLSCCMGRVLHNCSAALHGYQSVPTIHTFTYNECAPRPGSLHLLALGPIRATNNLKVQGGQN